MNMYIYTAFTIIQNRLYILQIQTYNLYFSVDKLCIRIVKNWAFTF